MRWKLMMSKSEIKPQMNADKRRSRSAFICVHPRLVLLAALVLLLLLNVGCRRDMQDQPKMKPYRGTSFFGDGLSSRQPIEGTVARGFLRSDTAYYTGKKTGVSPAASPTPGTAQPGNAQANTYPDDVDTFPFPVTKEIVMRGRERYAIFCSVCHGLTGNGDGMVVRRGFRRAASFNDDRLRQAPVGHFFDAITNGWGAMPSYASQIPVQDRWAIISYIRALQTSQSNPATASGSPSPAASPAPTTGGHE
jgi:mono/diheme cytochrome c family protein